MYIRDIVRRSGRSLKSAKIRTILTALAIGVGGFTLTLTLAAGNGATKYADNLIKSNFDPSELIVARDANIFNNGSTSSPQEYDDTISTIGGGRQTFQLKRLTQDDVTKVRQTEGIEQVREGYQVSVQYITREGQKRLTASAEAYNGAQRPETKAGSLPKNGDITDKEILIPDAYLGPLGFANAQEAVGKTVTLVVRQPFSQAAAQQLLSKAQAGATNLNDPKLLNEFQTLTTTYTIRAVSAKAATSLSFGVAPLLVSNPEAKRLSEFTTQGTPDYQKFLIIYARVKNGDQASQLTVAKDRLTKAGYNVRSVEDTQKTLTQIVTILQSIVLVFGVITLIAAVFGIVNTQYISVLERTREIGLMKALGMRGRDVSRLFMLEATWIGFLGGVIGSITGLILGISLNPWITKKLDLGDGNSLLVFKPVQMLALLFALMLIATLAGWLPARKAAKLDPIEALRTE